MPDVGATAVLGIVAVITEPVVVVSGTNDGLLGDADHVIVHPGQSHPVADNVIVSPGFAFAGLIVTTAALVHPPVAPHPVTAMVPFVGVHLGQDASGGTTHIL